ncbi:MAG: AzlD domain-containing protein [Clostridia bacterium]|nr:AzlD domain-containing protein [Clostridia bacterium]MBQ1963025.1 AzlD domain-containing protein [Clostridia bacterium]MBQ5833437.1 AzlD domain-containing protein [Clostridia bacterium]
MRIEYVWYLLAMAVTTYLIRMIPFTLFRKKIRSTFARSFFYYIPYAVLSAMTFPAIFNSTGNVWSASAGVAVAILLAYFRRSLLTVALASCAAAFLVSLLPMI